MACSLSVTQDGDVGAISSPFFQLHMRSGGLDWEGGYESESCKENTETPGPLCFIFKHLYSSDPYRI